MFRRLDICAIVKLDELTKSSKWSQYCNRWWLISGGQQQSGNARAIYKIKILILMKLLLLM